MSTTTDEPAVVMWPHLTLNPDGSTFTVGADQFALMRTQAQDAARQRDAAEERATRLARLVQRLRTQIADTASRNAEAQDRIARLTRSVEHREALVAEAETRTDEARNDRDQLEEKVRQLTAERDQARREPGGERVEELRRALSRQQSLRLEAEGKIAAIAERLYELADEHDWCSDFDDEMEKFGFERRKKDWDVTATVTVTMQVSAVVQASDEDGAKEEGREVDWAARITDIGMYQMPFDVALVEIDGVEEQ